MDNKAQVSMGVLFGVGVIFLIFFTILLFTTEGGSEVSKKQTYIEKLDECSKVSNVIIEIYNLGDGASAIIDTEYIISVFSNNQIYVESDFNTDPVINLAYYGCHLNEFEDGIGTTLTDNFVVDRYDLDPSGGVHSCEDISYINDLMSKLDNYDIVFLEDSHLGQGRDVTCCDNTSTWDLSELDNWVKNGGTAIISEHVIKSKTGPSILFGARMSNDKYLKPKGVEPLTVINEDPLFPGLEVGMQLDFKDLPAANESSFDKDDDGIIDSDILNLKTIANYSNSRMGIVTWQYGSGRVHFFSDFVESLLAGPDFSYIVVQNIEETINLASDPSSSVICVYPGAISVEGKFTGKVKIKNVYGNIIVENIN